MEHVQVVAVVLLVVGVLEVRTYYMRIIVTVYCVKFYGNDSFLVVQSNGD